MNPKCYLDSNILIYFLDRKSPYHKKTIDLLAKLEPNTYSLFISPLVIDEFLYAIKRILTLEGIQPEQIFNYLGKAFDTIIVLSNLEIAPLSIDKSINRKVIPLMEQFRLRPRDAYHLLTMQENDIDEFATFDNDFKHVFGGKILKRVK